MPPNSTFHPANDKEEPATAHPAHSSPSSVYPEPTKGFGVTPPPLSHNEIQSRTENTSPSPLGGRDLGEVASDQPTPVVKVLSVRGVEYFMMSIALWLSASGLLWIILALINGASGFNVLVFPVSFLLVSLPVFAFFYLRLRRAELENPELRFDPSKRRLSQITQVFSFVACLTNTIAFVYIVMSKIAGDSKTSIVKAFLNLLVVYAIVGGILVYYWFDEHRNFNRGR